jgi:hypothetical protein
MTSSLSSASRRVAPFKKWATSAHLPELAELRADAGIEHTDVYPPIAFGRKFALNRRAVEEFKDKSARFPSIRNRWRKAANPL